MTPLQQWAHTGEAVRFPEPGLDLDDLFLFEAQRKVQQDRTVSLNGVVYEVDAALVGEKVTLRFDPAAAPERPVQVCHEGQANRTGKTGADLRQLLRQTQPPVLDPERRGPHTQNCRPRGLKLRTLPDEPQEEH